MAGLALLFTGVANTTRTLTLGPARRAATAGGFNLVREAASPLVVEVVSTSAPNTVLGTLDDARRKTFQEAPSAVGAGSVDLVIDDADVPLVTATDRMLRFKVYDRVAGSVVIGELERLTIQKGEESEQFIQARGKSTVGILEDAVVWPSRGPASLPIEDTRIFNFANEDFNDSSWGPAAHIAFQPTGMYGWEGVPARWPDPTASWIWAPGGNNLYADAGTCYFRKQVTFPSNVTKITLRAAIDDEAEIWFDGQQILTMEGYREYREVTIPVTPGQHIIAAKCWNDPQYLLFLPGGSLTGSLQYTVVTHDTLWDIAGRYYGDPFRWPEIYAANQATIDADAAAAGLPYTGRWAGHWIFPGQVLTIPGVPGPAGAPSGWANTAGLLIAIHEATRDGAGALLAHTDQSWKCLPYPAREPGMTQGEVWRVLLTEAQNRGCFPALTWTFNDLTDSAGQPWRQAGALTARVSDDYLTVLSQHAETSLIYSTSPAGMTLHLYDIDTPAAASSATYVPGFDITELENKREV